MYLFTFHRYTNKKRKKGPIILSKKLQAKIAFKKLSSYNTLPFNLTTPRPLVTDHVICEWFPSVTYYIACYPCGLNFTHQTSSVYKSIQFKMIQVLTHLSDKTKMSIFYQGHSFNPHNSQRSLLGRVHTHDLHGLCCKLREDGFLHGSLH